MGEIGTFYCGGRCKVLYLKKRGEARNALKIGKNKKST